MVPATEEAWQLHVAISHALSDGRESPWYGAWNMVLRDIIFRSFCRAPHMTITYPQYPVSKGVDTDDADINDDEDEEQDRTESDDAGVNKYDIGGGSRDVRMSPPTVRAVAPSPELIRSPQNKARLLSTPPPPRPPPPKLRTTRIPDILQMLHELCRDKAGIICFPAEFRDRIILIVEIKKATRDPDDEKFGEIFPQTDRQARHAFHASPTTTTLGVIIAIGPYWTYGEYFRSDLRPSPPFSEKEDPTYSDSPPLQETFCIRDYPPFAALSNESVLLLQTQASDDGMKIVRKRLQQINLCT
jgi:hypothetical protein